MIYLISLIHIKVQSSIHMDFFFHGFVAINATARPSLKRTGQNKIIQSAPHLVCYCSFEIKQFWILKAKSEIHAIVVLFKVQTSHDNLTGNTN